MTETNADGDGSTDRETEWAATTVNSWGRGDSESKAITNCLGYERVDPDRESPVSIMLWKVYVDDWQKIGPTGIDADEPLALREYELDPEQVATVHERAGLLDRATDEMMGNAETVRKKDLDPDAE